MNLLFQKEDADNCSLLNELEGFTLTMLRRILHSDYVKIEVDMNVSLDFLPQTKVDFGHAFSSLATIKKEAHLISEEELHNIESRYYKFLVRACKELLSCIPENIETLKKIKNLSPTVSLSHTRPQFSELSLELVDDQSKISDIESGEIC